MRRIVGNVYQLKRGLIQIPLSATKVSVLPQQQFWNVVNATKTEKLFSTFSALRQQEKKEEESDIVYEAEEEEKKTEQLVAEDIIQETETVQGAKESKQFQTETKRLLEIVATALYTDKEVFIRELISNASDALEKVRQKTNMGAKIEDKSQKLEIRISVDEKNKVFIIQDTGIGMSREELVQNIGTIAHSGSKQFLQNLKESGSTDAANIIGQFGVGFYSCFMVADKVKVYSRSALEGSKGYCWESIGGDSYSISEAEGVARGVKIVLHLKDSEKEFATKDVVERIIKKYSNFVAYKIYLNGALVNTLDAIWLKPKSEVSQEEHKEFFKYLTHTSSEPTYIIQFSTDVPLSIHSLFYVPPFHTEKMGMGKMDPGVNVYSKKVLIQAKHKDILPDWLRFLRGAVDSEDLPLNISREHLQDSPLIKKINGILTRKILKFFMDMMKQDREKYVQFYNEYNRFFKEGIRIEFLYKDELSKLLLFESSKTKEGELTSLTEYIERMQPDQKDIYYLIAPSRSYAEKSPYFEDFKKKDIEVLFLYDPLDEFTMSSIQYFENKDIKSVERAEAPKSTEEEQNDSTEKLTEEQTKELCDWYKEILPKRIAQVTASNRLSGTPALIKDPESSAMRLIRKFQNQGASVDIGPQKLEINASHPLIVKLFKAKSNGADIAPVMAEQLFDNALISAGLVEDPRDMLDRLNKLLDAVAKQV